MSKISTLLVAGGGGTVAAVSGAYLIKNGLGQGEIPEVSLLFDSVDAFEKGWKEEKSKCVNGFFDGDFDDSGTPLTTFPTGTDTFFNTDTKQTPYKSCVIVNWKRDDYGDSKWKDGKFTWTWTFVKGNEGFVNFNVAETISSETDKLKFTGVFYLLGKEDAGSGPKWKVKHKKEVKGDSKKIATTQIDNYFPKKGTWITEAELDSYWGFFKGGASGNQLQNVCGSDGDCTDDNKKPTSFKRIELSWEGAQPPSGVGADSRKPLKDWSENLTWWSSIYDTPSSWSLETKIGEFKGNWTKKT